MSYMRVAAAIMSLPSDSFVHHKARGRWEVSILAFEARVLRFIQIETFQATIHLKPNRVQPCNVENFQWDMYVKFSNIIISRVMHYFLLTLRLTKSSTSALRETLHFSTRSKSDSQMILNPENRVARYKPTRFHHVIYAQLGTVGTKIPMPLLF